MNGRSRTSSRCCGLTLIEVVAALVLMGTLLVAAVTARARHVHQLADARSRLIAIDAADQLLIDWYGSGGSGASGGVPVDAEGEVPDHHDLRWRTERVADADVTADDLGVQIVRLTIHAADGERGTPLVSVDLATPLPESDESDGANAVGEESR